MNDDPKPRNRRPTDPEEFDLEAVDIDHNSTRLPGDEPPADQLPEKPPPSEPQPVEAHPVDQEEDDDFAPPWEQVFPVREKPPPNTPPLTEGPSRYFLLLGIAGAWATLWGLVGTVFAGVCWFLFPVQFMAGIALLVVAWRGYMLQQGSPTPAHGALLSAMILACDIVSLAFGITLLAMAAQLRRS